MGVSPHQLCWEIGLGGLTTSLLAERDLGITQVPTCALALLVFLAIKQPLPSHKIYHNGIV
jgi:hypothetical protein